MDVQPNVGLQWRLVLTQGASSAGAVVLTAGGFWLLRYLNQSVPVAVAGGVAFGLIAAVLGTVTTFLVARSIKLRLWEAGDFASRIARGDLGCRLTPARADELGWLEGRLNEMAGHLETAVADLRRLAEQNERLAEQAGRGAALEERARLARDLHDTVNQQLFALAVGVAAVRRSLAAGKMDAAQAAAELGALEELARGSHAQIREIILQLRPVTLERHGLAAALREYAERMAGEAGWRLELDLADAPGLDAPVREALFRIGQEALANVRKHAGATHVTISLREEDGAVIFSVADDGAGFNPKEPVRLTAVGMASMKERIQEVGGSLTVTSSPGAGTTVTAVVPLKRQGGEGG